MPVSYKQRASAVGRMKKSYARQKLAITRTARMQVSRAAVMSSRLGRVMPGTQEVKAVDTVVANGGNNGSLFVSAINTTAVVTPINLIQAGSTFCNRIGRRVNLRSLFFTAWLQNLNTVNASFDYARVIVVYDRQTNGATPAIADILQNTDQATANTTTSLSNLNLNNRERFVILMDERMTLPPVALTTAAGTPVPFSPDTSKNVFQIRRYINLKGLPTHFKADSSPAVIGDISTGGLFLVTFGTIAAASESYACRASWRLRYDDA